MHELSRMDDETGDPLPGDRRLAPIPVDLPFGAVAPNGCSRTASAPQIRKNFGNKTLLFQISPKSCTFVAVPKKEVTR